MDEITLKKPELIQNKGHYEIVKEYTKEVPAYDKNGNQTGTKTIVLGRDCKWVWDDSEEIKNYLRHHREAECFSIINRGQLWHDGLTGEQRAELKEWYIKWLDITETLVVPKKPEWLK